MGLFRLKIVSKRKITHFTMQITIRGQESYLLDFNGDESLEELRARICERENSEDILLYVSGKPLSEEGVISSLENCAVDVTVPLLGGKVHGSLARAGKVRGQTPKVDAQEKENSIQPTICQRCSHIWQKTWTKRKFISLLDVL